MGIKRHIWSRIQRIREQWNYNQCHNWGGHGLRFECQPQHSSYRESFHFKFKQRNRRIVVNVLERGRNMGRSHADDRKRFNSTWNVIDSIRYMRDCGDRNSNRNSKHRRTDMVSEC